VGEEKRRKKAGRGCHTRRRMKIGKIKDTQNWEKEGVGKVGERRKHSKILRIPIKKWV